MIHISSISVLAAVYSSEDKTALLSCWFPQGWALKVLTDNPTQMSTFQKSCLPLISEYVKDDSQDMGLRVATFEFLRDVIRQCACKVSSTVRCDFLKSCVHLDLLK